MKKSNLQCEGDRVSYRVTNLKIYVIIKALVYTKAFNVYYVLFIWRKP